MDVSGVTQTYQHHQVVYTLIAYYLGASAVGTMPPTTDKSPAWYRWLHDFLHVLAANAAQLMKNKLPTEPVTQVPPADH